MGAIYYRSTKVVKENVQKLDKMGGTKADTWNWNNSWKLVRTGLPYIVEMTEIWFLIGFN